MQKLIWGSLLAILPSSLLSRVFPGSERLSVTSIIVGPAGMTGRTLDQCKAFRTFARAPPKIAPNLSHGYTENDAKSAKKSPIGKWDLGAQTCSKPILRKDSQRTLSGNVIQFSIGFGTQNWPQIHQNFDFFRFFRQIHTFNYFLSPGVSVVYWDSLRAAERPI